MARHPSAARPSATHVVEEIAGQLNTLADGDPSMSFAFPSLEEVEGLISLLRGAADLVDETGFSARAAVISTFSEPEFDWHRVEGAIGLASPAHEFRDEVAEAVLFCVMLQWAFRQKPDGEDREVWSKAAAHLATAAAEVDKARAVLTRLPGWTDEMANQLLAPEQSRLDAWAWIAARKVLWSPKRRGRVGPRPMIEFRSLVTDLADSFTRATGHKPVVFWNDNEDRYEGPFLILVEAVLPGLVAILHSCEGPPLSQPKTEVGRGQFIVRTLRKDKTRAAEH